jgi:predicted permease
MEQTLPFLILLAAGQVMRRIPGFPVDTDRSLNLYVIYVALPALVLVQVPHLALSSELLAPLLMPWLVVVVSGSLVWLLCRMLGWSREITGALLLMVPLGNTSFLGIPMVEMFFGSPGVKYAILYDQFGSFLALSTYGTFILALYGGGEKPSPAGILRKIVFFPPFIALVAALVLRSFIFPAWLLSMLELTARSLVPVVLFETALPSMVTAGALASIAGLAPRLTSALVGYGILASFVTLPFIFHLIT